MMRVTANDDYRPLVFNPRLHYLCDLSVRLRIGVGVPMSGANVDINSAYEQYFYGGLFPLYFSTVVEVDDLTVKRGFKQIVVAYVGGCFGYTRGGYDYGEYQEFFDWHHNRDGILRFKTYADDGMMADASSSIKISMRRYCEAPIGLLGKQSVEDDLELVSWQDKLLGIGWELD